MNLKARELLSHEALNNKLDELENQERKNIAELARKSVKLEKEPEATEERMQGLSRPEGKL